MRKNESIGSRILFAIFVLGVLQAFGENHKEPAVTLVKDGKAMAEIIIPENPLSSIKLAAEDLQSHLEKISGAKLPITTTPSGDVENHVYVGESDHTKKLGVTTDDLKVEGFKIVAKGHNLILVGHDKHHPPFPYSRQELDKWREITGVNYGGVPSYIGPRQNAKLGFSWLDATATLYAVSEFLEQLGVRWYMPYENGTVIPEKKTIEIPAQSIKKEPRFPYRNLWRCGLRFDSAGTLWNKRLKYGTSYVYYNNHTTPAIMRLNPKFRAIADGKPIPGHRNIGMSRLCDPEFRKASMKYLDDIFNAYPALMGMSLGMPDGLGQIDERDAKLWPPQHGLQDKGLHHFSNKFSNYVWDYWLHAAEELKKSHPDKYLTCLGYPPYFEPPTQIDELPDNVTLQLCYWTTNLILPEGRHFERIRDQWISKLSSKKLFTWDYFLFYYGDGPKYPVAFTKLLQKEMRKLNGVCEGKFIETQSDYQPPWRITCPGLTHLLYYLQAKLFWDPDLDLNALLNEYYALYFGPANAEMKEFYEFAEEVWTRPEPRSISRVGGFLNEKDVDRYFDILKRAREKAGKDTVYDKRIAQIENEMERKR